MKVKGIELGHDYRHGYGEGARPGYKCEVEVQTGEYSFQSVKVRLSDEALRRVVDLIVAETIGAFVLDAADVDLIGAPGVVPPEPSDRITADETPL